MLDGCFKYFHHRAEPGNRLPADAVLQESGRHRALVQNCKEPHSQNCRAKSATRASHLPPGGLSGGDASKYELLPRSNQWSVVRLVDRLAAESRSGVPSLAGHEANSSALPRAGFRGSGRFSGDTLAQIGVDFIGVQTGTGFEHGQLNNCGQVPIVFTPCRLGRRSPWQSHDVRVGPTAMSLSIRSISPTVFLRQLEPRIHETRSYHKSKASLQDDPEGVFFSSESAEKKHTGWVGQACLLSDLASPN